MALNLALVWQCFAATRLMLHALVLGLECKLAVSTISTQTNLRPRANPVVVLAGDINGDPIMRHFVESAFKYFMFPLMGVQKKKSKKQQQPELTTKKKKHQLGISSPLLSSRQSVFAGFA